jgi:hypothetical protein
LVTEDEGKAWFAIQPEGSNIIPIPVGAEGKEEEQIRSADLGEVQV